MSSSRVQISLHRLAAQGFGHGHGLSHIVGIGTPTKATAQETVVDVDILRSHTGDFGGGRQGAFRILRADPHVDTLRRDLRRAVHRLHGGMRQIGHLVIGLHHLGRALERCQRIPLLFGHHSRFVQGRRKVFRKSAELALACAPKSHSTGMTSSAVLARQKLSATTAMPLGISTAARTPGMLLMASKS